VSDGNTCTIDSCDPATGLPAYPWVTNGRECTDLNQCTENDRCTSGQCSGTFIPAIDDRNPCTIDSCAPTTGFITHAPNPGAAGATCDNGLFCTSQSACDASGHCVATAFAPAKPRTTCTPPPGGTGEWVCNGEGACVGETPITTFCYDGRGNMTKKHVCPAGQGCPDPCG
jgi:hypothetical protein